MIGVMADLLIQFTYRFYYVNHERKFFRKHFIRHQINALKRKYIKMYVKKDSYTAKDLVSFALLVDTAKKLELCSNVTTDNGLSLDVSFIKGDTVLNHNIFGIFNVVDPIGNTVIFKSSVKPENNISTDDGSIEMSWMLAEDNKSTTYHENVYKLSKDIVIINKPYITGLSVLSYRLLPSIMKLYIEMICMGLKEKYL